MRWKEVFGKDWVLKVLSIAFAILLWFFVVGEEKAEVGLSIPLEIVNVPPNLVIANDLPTAIEARVYGPRSMIRAVATQRLSRVIDLRDAGPGEITIRVRPESLPLPGGVRPVRIQPSQLVILLEPLVRKGLPVKAVLTGKVSADYEISHVTVDPPVITLAGPSSEIQGLKEINTLPVDLNGASATVIREVGLDPQGLHYTTEQTNEVIVTMHIKAKQGSRRLTHVPIHVEATREGVSWWPRVVTVTVEGPVDRLRQLEATDIVVRVAMKGLDPGTHKVKPSLEAPTDIRVEAVSPDMIRLTIP